MAYLKIIINGHVVRGDSWEDPRGEHIATLTEAELKLIASEYVEHGPTADVRIVYTGNKY